MRFIVASRKRFVHRTQSQSKHWNDVAYPFRKHEPVQIRRGTDQGEQVRAPLAGHFVVEHVGQARAEHPTAPAVLGHEGGGLAFPLQRLLPVRGAGALARLAGTPLHFVPALVHQRLGVAVIAARRNLRAADEWVEGAVAP